MVPQAIDWLFSHVGHVSTRPNAKPHRYNEAETMTYVHPAYQYNTSGIPSLTPLRMHAMHAAGLPNIVRRGNSSQELCGATGMLAMALLLHRSR